MPALTISPVRLDALLGALLTTTSLGIAQDWRPVPPPTARSFHATAFDSTRGRTVLFGGSVPGSRMNETWEYDGSTWTFVSTPSAPPARDGHALVFDAARGVTVLFGGFSAGVRNDTWEYDGTTWTQVATPTSPPARTNHAMSYDASRGVVLFGGSPGAMNDTWTYDGATWAPVATATTPPGRSRHGMAYDAARGVHVVFGGIGTGYLGDTWELNGSNWSPAAPASSPPARMGMAMTYDAAQGAVVMFGGYVSNQIRDDTWRYDGNWTQQSPTAAPAPRWGATMAFDASRNRAVVFGGSITGGYDGSTWEYDGTNWIQTLANPMLPASRMGCSLAYDALRRRAVCFGGIRFQAPWTTLADTWEHDGTTWAPVTTANAPSQRAWHGLSHDAARGRVVLYGGGSPGGGQWNNLHDTWEYDGIDWYQVPTVNAPTASLVYAMTYDLRRRRHVVFGGLHATGPGQFVNHDETWEYDGVDWTQITTANKPSARSQNGLTYDVRRGVVVAFGGGSVNPQNDTWEYDGADWTQVLTVNAPAPRYVIGSMAYDPAQGKTLLFGGISGNGSSALPWIDYGDTWEYDGGSWQPVAVASNPAAITAGGMVYDSERGRMLRFGGGHAVGTYTSNDTWEYLPAATPAWSGYGTGCPGSVGTPFLYAGTMPVLGSNFVLNLSNLPATPTHPRLLFVGHGFEFGQWNGQPLPLDLGSLGLSGCSLWIGFDPALSVNRSYSGYSATITTVLPNLPALAGLRLGTQVLVLDLGAPNGIGALSNGGIGTIH